MKQTNIINYGFGKEYLSKWGLKEALREIFQNFIDYGKYDIKVKDKKINIVNVTITNNYIPEKLEFLRIGNSDKRGNLNAIGHHGEGLKMAFLIFLRENLNIKIFTNKYILYPKYVSDENIGETMSIEYKKHRINDKKFTIQFECDKTIYEEFIANVITIEDVIFFNSYHGEIVNKKQGNIYSGRLFVCNCNNLSKSYNIPPSLLELDRDRSMPRTWDINYHTSKLNQEHAQWNTKDLSYNDTLFIDNVPENLKKEFKPKLIGNQIEFVIKDEEGITHVVKNDSIKKALMNDSYFKKIITAVKKFVAKKLGLYDLLIEFGNKHVKSMEAKRDFEIILARVKGE